MKKIIISIICFLSIFGTTNAFFGSASSLDLYKNIDKGLVKLEKQMQIFELEGGTQGKGILKEINEYAMLEEFPACLDESKTISIESFEKIIKNGNTTELSKYQVSNCLEKQIHDTKIAEEKEKINKFYNEEKEEIEEYYLEMEENASEAGEKIDIRLLKRKILRDIDTDRIKKINNLKVYVSDDYKKQLSIDILNGYLIYFDKYNKDTDILSKTKAKQIYKLSNIGLYSDGKLENSGFDLIVDLEEIDRIIFASTSNFEGVPNESLEEELDKLFEPLQDEMNNIKEEGFLDNILGANEEERDEENIIYSPPRTYNLINEESEILGINNYICPDDTYNSGLSEASISYLLNNIEKNLDPNNNIINQNNILDNNIDSENDSTEDDESNNEEDNSNYEKIRDNSEWPCEQFFCITIDFIVNENNLFGSFEYTTIEYLLNRSNSHLRKFASSSMIPSKMTTNNFELGLKDINLSDIFHIGFQISTKPVPILNIEKKDKKDEGEYSAKNLLERHYKANGLDYKRRNDLNILKSLDANKQIINNGNTLSIATITKNFEDYQNESIIKINKNNLLNKAIEKKVSNGVMQTFETQFIEISKFTVGINNYIKNLDSIISAMRKIPIDNG